MCLHVFVRHSVCACLSECVFVCVCVCVFVCMWLCVYLRFNIGDIDEQHVHAEISKALIADLGNCAEVVQIKSNSNSTLGERFVAAASHIHTDFRDSIHLRFLWHGCSPGTLGIILDEGFKTSFSSLDFNVYGAGIYFAIDAKLSVFFLTRNPVTLETIPPDADGCYTLVLAAVLLGKTGVREPLMGGSENQKKKMEGALKHPANRNPPVGCHSATGQRLKEAVIYENTNAFPAFTVKFRIKEGVPPYPNPYDEDDTTNHTYLRSLHDAPHGIVMRRKLDGTLTELDTPHPDSLIENAPLLLGWCSNTKNNPEVLSRPSSSPQSSGMLLPTNCEQQIGAQLAVLEQQIIEQKQRIGMLEQQNLMMVAALVAIQKSRTCVIS